MIRYSVLDLAPITQASDAHAERVRVHRYWIAEHIYDHGARVRSYEIVAEVRV